MHSVGMLASSKGTDFSSISWIFQNAAYWLSWNLSLINENGSGGSRSCTAQGAGVSSDGSKILFGGWFPDNGGEGQNRAVILEPREKPQEWTRDPEHGHRPDGAW